MTEDHVLNPVRRDAHRVMKSAEYVSVDEVALRDLAAYLIAECDFNHASWDAPVYPSLDAHTIEEVTDFIMVGNALNYTFNDLNTGEDYTVEFQDTVWSGAYGMWAALRRAFDAGTPLLDATYLQGIDQEEVEQIFEPAGDTAIPSLPSRVTQLRAVGELMEEFGGSFAGAFTSPVQLYGDDGLVEQLAASDAYRDAVTYDDTRVRFDKRAQLTVSMLYGKLMGTPYTFEIADINSFTVFADYGIPAGLRARGVLEYADSLADTIDNQDRVPRGSPEEVEIRAATVVVGDRLRELLADEHDTHTVMPVLDFVLWQMRRGEDTEPHLTKTTAY